MKKPLLLLHKIVFFVYMSQFSQQFWNALFSKKMEQNKVIFLAEVRDDIFQG